MAKQLSLFDENEFKSSFSITSILETCFSELIQHYRLPNNSLQLKLGNEEYSDYIEAFIY